MKETFPLEEGVTIEIPDGSAIALFEHSERADHHPDTPIVARLDKGPKPVDGAPQLWSFTTTRRELKHTTRRVLAPLDGGPLGKPIGKILFLPSGLMPGDTVTIKWVDPTCACATKVA